ncbi:MAG: T9SS type A sorting domain-containing protein, partial [Balneolales bacterium]|nr:T9SS type A sorting domain-containing protein [Balneolales bacterium]
SVNVITDNGGDGIRVGNHVRPVINRNSIYGNNGYDIRMESGTQESIDARFNWWGEATTAVMNTGGNPKNIDKIYDRFDDANLSLVNYAGWLDAPVDPTRPPSPTLRSPNDGVTGLSTEVTMIWTAVSNATSYQLQVAPTNTFAVPSVDQAGISDTTFTATTGLSFGTQYFWRVRAENDNGVGSWSAPRTFRTVDLNLVENTFATAILVTDASGVNKDVIIGANAAATDGFDSEFDQLAPPQPPIGVFDVRLVHSGQEMLQDFRPITEVSTQWRLRFSPSGNGWPVQISWDPESLAKGGIFSMRDAITGEFVNVDMRRENQVQIEFEFITELVITHTMRFELTQSYQQRWNMVSLPVQMEVESYQDVFPAARASTMFGFNSVYFTADSFSKGQGYWLFMEEPQTLEFAGVPLEVLDIDLRAGWNLVSGLSYPVPLSVVEDPGNIIIPGTLFDFTGAYTPVTTLQPGKGYWLRTQREGTVSMRATGSGMARQHDNALLALRPVTQLMQSHDRIVLTRKDDAAPSSQSVELFFGSDLPAGVNPAAFTLPPIPPAGNFDARFTGDFYATDAQRVEVMLQRGEDDLHLSIQSAANANGSQYRLTEFMGPIELRVTELRAGEEVMLFAQTTHFTVENLDVADLPTDFELTQNFPNPFNPTTTIRYALPKETMVRIDVYSVLGQRVTTLVNESRAAGWHSVRVDGTSLSSGVYVYRISAGGFTETRKMILVK